LFVFFHEGEEKRAQLYRQRTTEPGPVYPVQC
jgi:hypothetical protein